MASVNFHEQLKNLSESYSRDGYGVVENFLNQHEIDSMRQEAMRLIKQESRRDKSKLQIFGNDFNVKNKYFLESGDKICYLYEKNAVNLDTLELRLPEEQSLAKIAHALHCFNPVFNEITTSERVKDVYRAINFVNPTVVQSMIIFKNPKVGGAYSAHQDASFLYAEPQHLAGVWIALDDATPENGCLEFIPGSHSWPVKRRLVQTNSTNEGDDLLEWTAHVLETRDEQFVRVPVKKGDMVLIHGKVVHRSAANESEKPRWIYTFHAYDKGRAVYSPANWLQMKENNSFMSLY